MYIRGPNACRNLLLAQEICEVIIPFEGTFREYVPVVPYLPTAAPLL